MSLKVLPGASQRYPINNVAELKNKWWEKIYVLTNNYSSACPRKKE
jgi:hypothetical protein